ncbi:hypothetical protein EC957_002758 [Mortierella hygrophila]|uniref:Uncharacterized protein n=1 Tax=Mortierella hygrophila TaxID=979708 RepID=A0A9P6F2Y4_9FUNG|nr:hypothetical protein EC957_002758 [Mortierella hygrophila]
MSSFMSMQYDSDSDSADDLDFEPASDGSSGSDGDSAADEDMDETMEGVEGDTDAAGSIVPTPAVPSTKASASKKKYSPRAQQTSATSTPPATVVASSSVQVSSQPVSTDSVATPGANVSTGAGDATTEPLAGASGSSEPTATATGDASATGSAPVEVVKKKKGPKKGTKYKKRATAAPDAGGGLAPKYPKMTKKAAAAAAAAVAAAAASSRTMANAFGRFGLQNTQVDLDHPLETFKWPYSPFTTDFKTQHQARGTMAKDLHQAVQQITESNNRSTWHLQELDQQLQMSRQDLKTSLDEIQFRKSQLRDMSLMAADIVRKLSSSSSSSRRSGRGAERAVLPSSSSSTSALPGGTESVGRASDLDSDAMEVDGAEEMSASAELGQLRLNELNESNVRSFLEKIRELEQHQRHIMV